MALPVVEKTSESMTFHSSREPNEKTITTAGSLAGAKIHVGVIDEYPFTRECICSRLKSLCEDFKVISFVSVDDYAQAGTEGFEVVLLHVHGGELRGRGAEETIASLKIVLRSFPVIILSDLDSTDSMLAAFENGARGYIPTSSTSVAVAVEAIRLVRAGGVFVPPSSLRVMNHLASTPQLALDYSLTSRQSAVLYHLMQGKPNKIIAHELEMSESTVKVHIRNIMKKVQANNRTEVVFRAHNIWAGAHEQPVLSPRVPQQTSDRCGMISQ
jgi:DNA-binding NarL/FixJ family response regulator